MSGREDIDPDWRDDPTEVDLLRAELERQWLVNHDERCGEWPHPEGKRCYWERPSILP